MADDQQFSRFEQRLHDACVSVAELVGEFKHVREDLRSLGDKIDSHAKQSAESHAKLDERIVVLEGDVNTAKKGLKAIFDKAWPVLVAAFLGALASRGIIPNDTLAKLQQPSAEDKQTE